MPAAWAAGAAAVVGGVTAYMSADAQSSAAEQAAQAQRDASQKAQDTQYAIFQEQKALQQPWYEAGRNALSELQGRTSTQPLAFQPSGQYALPSAFQAPTPFSYTAEDFAKGQDPGYAFRLKEGLKALDRTASARGGLLSGGALKAAAQYGQEMGSQEYQNAYNRAASEYQSKYAQSLDAYNAAVARANTGYGRDLDAYNAAVAREASQYNRLASLAGTGQTSANTIGGYAGNYGNAASQLISNTGASNANALIAQGNATAAQYGAIGNAIGGMAGAYGGYQTNQQNQANFNNYLNALSSSRQSTYPSSQQTYFPYGR